MTTSTIKHLDSFRILKSCLQTRALQKLHECIWKVVKKNEMEEWREGGSDRSGRRMEVWRGGGCSRSGRRVEE